MTADETAPIAPDARREPRSSMFVAAVMRSGTEQVPIKIRNMSPNGAMIDTPLMPTRGTNVRIVRGALLAEGTVVWSAHNRCGLRFSSELSVKEWLAAPSKGEQQRVDEIVALVKAGVSLGAEGVGTPITSRSNGQLRDDLEAVIGLMQDLEYELASSNDTVARHAAKLQNLDIAMQMIRAIAQELSPSLDGQATSIAKIADLRIACAKALSADQNL